jgi:outer membrane protein assembly factor BamD (BamD/ComL family)
MLVQEREVIAIEALVKTGRKEDARTRADRFKTRFPGSSHTRRLDALLAN